MSNDKLVKELLIHIKQKNLKPTVKVMSELSDHLDSAAISADKLDDSLKPIPESLKEIIREGQDVNSVFNNLGSGGNLDKLEGHFESLDSSLDELVGSVLQLQDAFTVGLGRSTDASTAGMKELIISLERVEDSIDGVERSARRDTQTTIQNTKAHANQSKQNERHHRNNAKTARGFAAIAEAGGSLTVAYAVVAANVYALTAAFSLLADAAQLTRLEEIGNVMGTSLGVPVSYVAKQLQEATGYTVSFQEALRQASSASTFGFTTDQIMDMTVAARRASVALGVDMNDALNRITRGVSKLEIELLDELGITVRLTQAYDEYAKSIGVSVTALTTYQKQQAYLNAVLRESEARQGKVDPYMAANNWEALSAAVAEATREGLQWMAEFLDPAAEKLSYFFQVLSGSKSVIKGKDILVDFNKTLRTAHALGDRAGIFAGLSTGADEAEKVIAELENGIKILQSRVDRIDSGKSGKSWLDATLTKGSLRDGIAEAKKSIEEYKQAATVVGEVNGIFSKSFADLGNDVYAGAKSIATFKETLTAIESAAGATGKNFEQLDGHILDISKNLDIARAMGESLTDVYKQMGIAGIEDLNYRIGLTQALRNEFVLQATLQERLLRGDEEGIRVGEAKSTATKRAISLELQLLNAQLAVQNSLGDKTSPAEVMSIQSKIAATKLKQLEVDRMIVDESIRMYGAYAALGISQESFFKGQFSQVTEYSSALQSNILQVEMLRKEQAKLLPHQEEYLALELAINEALRARYISAEAERQKQEGIRQSRSSAAAGASGGIGPLAQDTINLQESVAALNAQYAVGNVTQDEYNAKSNEQVLSAIDLNQRRLEQEASLNNLFLSRTGQQSILAMNQEELLKYHQGVGAAMYDSARGALESMDPVMGQMFNGLEMFGNALLQVGETSESVWNGVSSGIQAASGVMAFMSDKAVSGIEKQIAIEKKKDGKSAESLKKIAAMEAAMDKEKMKADKVAIVSNTAVGIMQAYAQLGVWGSIPAAMIAAMGAMQLSSLDSGVISGESGSIDPAKLELGERSNSIDLSRGATMGELSYMRGSQGTGGIQDFVPRARGNSMSGNVRYLTGEHGTEEVSSAIGMGRSSVTSNEDVDTKNSKKPMSLNLTVNALDAASIMDRSEDIFRALEEAANARGFSISSI